MKPKGKSYEKRVTVPKVWEKIYYRGEYGTKHMIELAKENDLQIHVELYEKNKKYENWLVF
jgi:hypothetical protein